MRYFIPLLLALVTCQISYSQDEIKYLNPPTQFGESYEINCLDILSEKEFCKFKLVINNTSSESFLVYDYKKVGFEYSGFGTYYPRKGKRVVIFPNKKESKVIKVVDNLDYRVGSFYLDLNGLMSAIPEPTPVLSTLPLELDANSEADDIIINCVKFSKKKGKVSASIEILYNGSDDGFVVVDPTLLKILDEDNNELEATVFSKKMSTLFSGEKLKLKLTFKSELSSFLLNSKESLKLLKMVPLKTDKILVKNVNSVDVSNTVSSENTSGTVSNSSVENVSSNSGTHTCPPFRGPNNASVQVKFLNEDGKCFKLHVDGVPVIPNLTSNAVFYMNPGRAKLKVTLPNGEIIEKKVIVADAYDVIGYRLKEKKSGEFVIKYEPFDQVLNATGEKRRADMMASTKAKTEANTSSNSTNSSNGSSESSDVGCFGEASSGSTTVKLKITWKGSPVSGHDVQIKHGDFIIGNNKTDGGGIVNIKTSDLKSPKLDVYGCKGGSDWSVSGDWVYLDGSNYFHLKLDEVAEFMAEMMGMTADQIGAGWGM